MVCVNLFAPACSLKPHGVLHLPIAVCSSNNNFFVNMANGDGQQKPGLWTRIDRQCRAFANFAWNKETHEFMGRGGKSWAKIGLFYVAYYGFLAAFFCVCLAVFLTTLNDPGKGGPKSIQFLVGDSAPGLGIIPASSDLKQYTKKVAKCSKAADDYLKGFANKGYTGKNCSSPNPGKLCKYDLSLLGSCQTSDSYSLSKPCVYVKINKVYGWIPKTDVQLICSATGGTVEVLPTRGYLKAAFPFEGQSFYQTPPVAVRITHTADKVDVKCELKAAGIKTSETFIATRAYGKIRFEVTK